MARAHVGSPGGIQVGVMWAALVEAGLPTWDLSFSHDHIFAGPTWGAQVGPTKLPTFSPTGSRLLLLTG